MAKGGSIRSVTFDGIPFDVKEDSDVSIPISNVEKESMPTSGEPLIVLKKRVRKLEGLNLVVTSQENEILKELDERIEPFAVTVTEADGTSWRCAKAQITTGNRTTQEQTAEVSIIPSVDWEVFTGGV